MAGISHQLSPREFSAGAPARLRRLFGGVPRVIPRGAIIARAGEPCRQIFLVASGWASCERLLPDGRRALLDLYLPGDLLNLEHLFVDSSPNSLVALTPVGFHALDGCILKEYLQHDAELVLLLLERATAEKRRQQRQMTRLARLHALERTAAFLAGLSERLVARIDGNGSSQARVPLTQRDLADLLGLNIIHLNRTLRTLRDAGAVQTRNGSLVISDVARLCSIAPLS